MASRLDYCNSLLYGLAEKDIKRLQWVQNCLARVVTKKPPRTPSLPLLMSLQWLPIKFRIQFKINLLTFKTLSTQQPSYLHNLLNKVTHTRSLRSNSGQLLAVPRVKSKTGSRAFCVCAPSLWNSLPVTLHSATSTASFRKSLKTHLFDLAFPP